MSVRFSKMHGIGNDFVVIDCRTRALDLDTARIAQLGDRHLGIGFDQLLTIEPPRDASCAYRYGIYNADGSPAAQCGNGVRCVAAWLRRAGALQPGKVRLESPSGPVEVEMLDDGRVCVDMGMPRFAPADVPFSGGTGGIVEPLDVDGIVVEISALSIGNPHAVQLVADVDTAPVSTQGPSIERHPRFPARVNAGYMQIVDRATIRLRVFERGAGETLACGTGACAAVVAGRRRGLLDERVRVVTRGGELTIRWPGEGGPVIMKGPARTVFEGEWRDADAGH